MAYGDSTIQGTVIRNPGPITDNVWKGDGSDTWKKGQLLMKSTDGTVNICSASHATNGIHLVAMTDVDVAVTTYVSVMEILPSTEFEVQLHHDTPASAVPADSQKGQQFAFVVASNVWGLDLEDESAPDFEVTEIYQDYFSHDPAGNGAGQFGLVRAKVLSSRITAAPA